MPSRIAPKLLAEFIGTFSFVFIGAGTAAVVGDGARRMSPIRDSCFKVKVSGY
jgi:glycerol uptake facilitator-like aquaporin